MKMNLRKKWLETQNVKIEIKESPKQPKSTPEPVQETLGSKRGRKKKVVLDDDDDDDGEKE